MKWPAAYQGETGIATMNQYKQPVDTLDNTIWVIILGSERNKAMKRRETNRFSRRLFMVKFGLWVLVGGLTFSQTPAGDTPKTPQTVQEKLIPLETNVSGLNARAGIASSRPFSAVAAETNSLSCTRTKMIRVFSPWASIEGTLSQDGRYSDQTLSLTIVANGLKCCDLPPGINRSRRQGVRSECSR